MTDAVRPAYGGSIALEAETDADGVFDAHVVTRDSEEIIVEPDEEFEVTGVEGGR